MMRKKSIKSRKHRGHSPSKRQNILIFHQNPLQHPISALSASHVIIYCAICGSIALNSGLMISIAEAFSLHVY